MYRLTVLLAIVGVISSVAWADGASFRGLGFLPGSSETYAEDVSSDGSVVVGGTVVAGGGNIQKAFRWTDANGIESLGMLYLGSHAYATSSYGSVIVGSDWNQDHGSVPVRWLNGNGPQLIENYPPCEYTTLNWAHSVSSDGQFISGWSLCNNAGVFRWSESSGTIWTGLNAGGYGISDNGTVTGCTSSGYPAIWTETDGIIILGTRSGWALNISNDGSVAVGQCFPSTSTLDGREAFYWTSQTGIIGLGELEGGIFYSEASDVSADGETIVGKSCTSGTESDPHYEAFIWHPESGMANLKEVMVNTYGLDLNGWTLTEARGISADGQTIVGKGIDPNGHQQGWIFILGQPVTLTIAVEPNNVGINTITPSAGQHIFYNGRSILLNASVYKNCPNVFRFSHWLGDVNDPNSATTTITMNQNKTVTAVYYADARRCGDECHPILQGDLNRDCRINLEDFALYCANWLSCTHPDCD